MLLDTRKAPVSNFRKTYEGPVKIFALAVAFKIKSFKASLALAIGLIEHGQNMSGFAKGKNKRNIRLWLRSIVSRILQIIVVQHSWMYVF